MPSFSRSVTVNWSGPLREGGKGEVKAGTGAFTLPISFPSRVSDAAGVTSPEELIAAAHGACYAMALNATVGRKGGAIGKTHITCTISADLGDVGIKIMSSKLTVVAEGPHRDRSEDVPRRRERSGRQVPGVERAARLAHDRGERKRQVAITSATARVPRRTARRPSSVEACRPSRPASSRSSSSP